MVCAESRLPAGKIFCALAASLLLWGVAPRAQSQPAPEPETAIVPKRAALGKRFMVVAANPAATRAGVEVIGRGGNALDAAIAVQMVLNLVEPQSSGLGGGGFLLYYSSRENRLAAFDGRETAPAAATPDRFLGSDGRPISWPDAVASGISVGVPGLLRMLETAHRRYGRLSWESLFQPAIRIAVEGFPISPRLHALVRSDRLLARDENARRYFYRPDGSAKPVGAVLKNPEFAAVLKTIAAQGANAFYRGEIAHDIVAAVRSHPRTPGDLTESDLDAYRAVERSPLCGTYRKLRICGMPPPSSGGVTVLQILGILEAFDLRSLRPNSVEAVHLFAEAGRLAYADRDAYVADPDFADVPLAGMLAPRYLKARARLVDPSRSLGRASAGIPPGIHVAYAQSAAPELPATTHMSIVDPEGNAVAMTTSIESAFGNRQMVRGFLLNNQLTDFSWVPEADGRPVANRVEPRKRPRSSMAPTMVFDGARLILAVGSPGGHSIINYVAETLVAVIDWGMDIQTAIALPHMGSRNGPTELERGTVLAPLAPGLRQMGHAVRVQAETSGLHGIQRVPSGWLGGADPRREGLALGG